ncbi:MAG: LPS export ABC transporter permease LptF [Gammaproteobacteria bacterium]|nr:LPS export ABC transporter permease LptF [Gammaproteobacteria bacterium]
MKLTIIDKYIAKELLTVCLAVYFVLLIIVLSTEVVHLLKWVSQGVIPLNAFLSYLFNSLFEFSVILIPLSLLMGILLAFGRLYSDSEMAAIMSAGIGPLQWYRPLMLIAIPATLLLLVLLVYGRPAIAYQRALIHAEVRSQSQLDTLLVGQFNRAGKGGGILFLESGFLESGDESGQQISNVFFQQQREQTSHVDLAENTSSYYDDNGRRYLMMHGGTHYVGNAGDANFKIIKYQDYGVDVQTKSVAPRASVKMKSVVELWHSTIPKDKAELQWRFTLPLATIIVAFMALPLSHTKPRSGRYSKLAISLIIYLLYSNLLGVGKTWIAQEKIPVWVGTWWVHLIAIIITLVLLKRSGYLSGMGLNKKGLKQIESSGGSNGT